jgi:integrase
MASVWKHPYSRFWTACFRDSDGRQRRVSTKETNRRRALKIAEAYEQASRGLRTKRQVRRMIERLAEELGGESICALSLRAFAQEWLATKRPEIAKATFDFYSGSIEKFCSFLGEDANRSIEEITKGQIVDYRNALARELCARSTNHDLATVKMLFRAARRDGVIPENPAEFVDAIRSRNSEGARRRAFTLPELQLVFAQADPEWRSMILFGLYTGQRLSDIASLTWNNIALEKAELRLITRKTARRLILPLAEPLFRHLESLPSSDDPHAPLHPRAFKVLQDQGRSGTLSNQFGDLLTLTGLRPPRPDHQSRGKGRHAARRANELSFHSLRKTATTLLHEAGVPQAVVMALVGHDSPEIHDTYIAVGKEALTKAAASLPEL